MGTDASHDADGRRLAVLRRILTVGIIVAIVLAVLAGLVGASGRAGAAIFLLVTATTCGVGASYGALTAVRDEIGDVPVSRTRVILVLGLFVATAGLMAMTAGVGG